MSAAGEGGCTGGFMGVGATVGYRSARGPYGLYGGGGG